MTKLTATIIEDEIPAARRLNKMLKELRPEWEIILLPGSIKQCVQWFSENPHPDIVFLDIQLTDGISFSFIEQARPQSIIIFTTAYDEYAVRAFTVNSIDYLLKPIDNERLEEALTKFERLYCPKHDYQNANILEALQEMTSTSKKYRTRFLISGDDKLFTLQIDTIAYFYSENKVTFAVAKHGKEYIIDLSLDKLTEQLDPDRFFRANRQIIVSVDAIERVESYFLGKAVLHVRPPFKDKIIVSRDKIGPMKLWLNY